MRRCVPRRFYAFTPDHVVDVMGAARAVNAAESHRLVLAGTAQFRETEMAVNAADRAVENQGFFFLPRMDYPVGTGIAPLMSKRQFDVQYNILHRDAVSTLNRLSIGTSVEGHSLETVIRETAFDATRAALHTSACEHFNYCFWYKSLRPWGTALSPRLREELQLQYGSSNSGNGFVELQNLMLHTALTNQDRSSWVYLVWTGSMLDVLEFQHGSCPISTDLTPLLTLNLHASAYGVDYDISGTDGLEKYVRNYFKTCNWPLAERYLTMAMAHKQE